MIRPPPGSPLFPYTPLFRSRGVRVRDAARQVRRDEARAPRREDGRVERLQARDLGLAPLEVRARVTQLLGRGGHEERRDRKSTRLNSSHTVTSYAVFCLQKM